MLNVIMLSVVMLKAIMLSVVSPIVEVKVHPRLINANDIVV